MKKSTLTEDKAEQTPTGGVLVGKKKGQTIIHNKGTLSGYLVGKTHDEGGIKAVNKSTGQALEMQGGEVVITAPAVSDNTKNEFNGKMMTNREVLSAINEKGGGVSFAKGGDIPKNIKRTGASYKYGGKTMTDHEIYKKITGGHLAEGMTLSQIAKKHNVSLKELQKQVDLGMKAESEHTSSKREQMKIVKDHLFENPKYYTLLKRVGLENGAELGKWKKLTEQNRAGRYSEELKSYVYKNAKIYYSKIDREWLLEINHKMIKGYPTLGVAKKRAEIMLLDTFNNGGRVHRASLVRDAKSGNTPARDLNNYNDVLDLDADSMVGAETGLYANGGMMANGGLIAPNGKPSNLTPEQYKLVRTPEFKAWFGDWEDKPNENMLIDENGEPMVLWHTGGNWQKLDESRGNGLMFAFTENTPAYSAEEKITRPFFIKSDFIYLVKYEDRHFPQKYKKPTKHQFPIYFVRAFGGFIIVHNSNQIKLADGTNITFDSRNPDIRYNNGGAVRRSSLVRDSKKGNTPARDLNNYNDVIDMDADGVYGAETGIYARGGSLSYAKGGATDVTVNKWSEIPDSFKNIRLPKLIDWNANPSDDGLNEIVKPFLSKEPLRPEMEGINFDDNGITATNAHILLTIPTVDHEFQGIYKKEKGSEVSIKIDAKYPNYEPIIPKQTDIKKACYVDILKLLTYFKVAINYSDNKQIVFKIDGAEMSVAPDLMINFLTSLIKLGGSQFMYVSFQTNKRALIFSYYSNFSVGKDVIALIMPYIYDKGESYGAVNKEKKAELNVYFDFDDNEIRNADDSIVDLSIKPTKTRAKRTPKTTESQASTQKGKTLIKEELEHSKIWIGDNLDLRDKVMAKLTEIGISVDSGYGDKDLSETENIYISIYTYDFVVYQGIKEYFNNDSKKEIFPWDLGIDIATVLKPTVTSTTTEKFTSGEIDMFNQIDAIVDSYGITVVSAMSWSKATSETTDFDIVDTLTGDVFQLRKYNLFLGGQYDDIQKEKSRALIKDYNEWKKSKPTKEIKKIEVFKLKGLSTAYSVYGATELLEDYKKLKFQYPDRELFPYRIYDYKDVEHDGIYFGKGIETISDLTVAIVNSPIYDNYDWTEFFAYGTKEDEKPVEQPKPSQTEKPKRNFELERKYLSQRISDLAKELDLKKPILSNEEVAFYQREINSFILKLRKLNDAEMSLKSIEERVRGVYDLKISSFDKEYPETDMTSINALKSQLTEKEYFNVRTPEFKSFFGDWETAYLNNSYSGVSKVINPVTKEPQPVFHGTNVLFVDWKTYDTNNAHYFAVKREFSEFFATTWEERTDKAGVDSEILKKLNPNRGTFLLRCFIDVKNPIDFSRFGVEKYPIREYLTFLRVNYNIGDFDFWTNITSHSGFTQDTEVYAWQIIRLWQSFTKYVKVFTTYDGYIFYEYIPTKPYGGLENASLSYCAFESNQIKFTDAYEFNALSNDSRFDLGGIL